VERFERQIAERLGVKHGVAVASGTAALHVSLLAAGVGADDEVVTSALSFIAPANAIRYTGAIPRFIDAEPRSWQLDVAEATAYLRESCDLVDGRLTSRATGRRVAAIVPVHILGHSVDTEPLLEVARELGVPVIADAAEAVGASYRDRPVGALEDASALSFNGNKVITTGGGGLIATNDEQLAARTRYLSTQAKDDPLHYVHGAVGFNYRLTNVAAAIGCAQVERLDEFVAQKRAIAARYIDAFAGVDGIDVQQTAPETIPSWWLFTILVEPSIRDAVIDDLRGGGILVRPLWQPLNMSPALPESRRSCPVAERLAASSISLPSSTGLTAEQQERTIAAVVEAVSGAH
jgi:perosamine synthetase